MISTGWVTLNGELLAYRLDGADGAPEKLDPNADLRQDSEMPFQPPTEYGRLYSFALGNARRLPPGDQQAISFVPVFFTAVFTE